MSDTVWSRPITSYAVREDVLLTGPQRVHVENSVKIRKKKRLNDDFFYYY